MILTRVVGDTAVEILLVCENERASWLCIGIFFFVSHMPYARPLRKDISFVACMEEGGGIDGVVGIIFSGYGENTKWFSMEKDDESIVVGLVTSRQAKSVKNLVNCNCFVVCFLREKGYQKSEYLSE